MLKGEKQGTNNGRICMEECRKDNPLVSGQDELSSGLLLRGVKFWIICFFSIAYCWEQDLPWMPFPYPSLTHSLKKI